jgi:NlpC/P60 family putative phage cell wall peptidase
MILTRDDLVTVARGWLGTPYAHQASLKGIGCDCLGLVRGVWREVMGEEPEEAPPYAPDWAESGGIETLAAAARRHLIEIDPRGFEPGDVVLFRWRADYPAKHAGIVTAARQMIHAQDGARVAEVHLNSWWLRHLAFAFRFPGVVV